MNTEQNQVYANDSMNTVAFIHRQDVSVWGGGATQTGRLRYDLSVDNGQSFITDVGVLNNTYTVPARYPNISVVNPSNSTTPSNNYLVYAGPTTNNGWTGFVSGTAPLVAVNPSATEAYTQFPTAGLPAALTEGLPGEFWMVEQMQDANATLDSVRVWKGTWDPNPGDVLWVEHTKLSLGSYTGYDGSVTAVGANIAFSPDGQHGWIALLGDLVGGTDSVLNPVFIHSTDGGATWGSPAEMDMSTIPWLDDSLQLFWTDSSGMPTSSGRATCAFDMDLTVDHLGNPHMAVVVGSSPEPPGYAIMSGLTKYLVDVTTTNGGSTFDMQVISPIVTFRGNLGPTASLIHDNHPQIARNVDGTLLFYSWMDSDTSLIGFGFSDNIAPNLFIAGLRVTDGHRTCNKNVTGGDLIWDGRALFPNMAPVVLTGENNGFDCFSLPIVVAEMLQNDPDQPTQFHYFGNEATFGIADFQQPIMVNIAFGQACTSVGCGFPPVDASINGVVWADSNNNGIQEANEPGRAGVLLQTTPGPWFTISDANGAYSLGVPAGTFQVEAVPPLYHNITYPSPNTTYSVTTATGSTSTGNDFGLYPTPNIVDVRVYISATEHRPGFNACHTLGVANLGTTTISGTLHYDYGSTLTYVSSSPNFTTHNGIDSLTWDFQNLAPGDYELYSACFNVPVNTQLGDTIKTEAEVLPIGGELSVANNRDSLCDIVVGSYDPNDKQVFPAGFGTNGIVDGGQWLTYLIRFQNTGTASAINVQIRDTLDEDFDISTFDMIGASHAYRLEMDGHGNVTWFFDNIMLPDSFTNEPLSHGFVKFRIQTPPSTPLGTDFNNTAAIYFDFNEPIITNTTQTRVDTLVGRWDGQDEMALTIFPNPFSEHTDFRFDRYNQQVYDFALYDLNGRKVREAVGQRRSVYRLERGDLKTGMYLYQIQMEGRVVSRGKVVLR